MNVNVFLLISVVFCITHYIVILSSDYLDVQVQPLHPDCGGSQQFRQDFGHGKGNKHIQYIKSKPGSFLF
jgi:hypothetical protein